MFKNILAPKSDLGVSIDKGDVNQLEMPPILIVSFLLLSVFAKAY